MGTRSKLLNRPLKAFALYSLLLLGISIPAYVLVIDTIWVSELDENNLLRLEHSKQNLSRKELSRADIEQFNRVWGQLEPGFSIQEVQGNGLGQDSIYEVEKLDPEEEIHRMRGLLSYITIDGQAYQIRIETNLEETDETFLAVSFVTAFFFLILILGFILLNRNIARRSWKPFYQTLASLKSFDLAKNQGISVESSTIQEFHELNESLQSLVESNLAAFRLQKAFTENASHELQTPIALIKSKLDLLVQEKELSPEINELISSIQAPLSRLNRINKNLLVLAKVENQHYQEQEELDIKKYMDASLVLFEDYISDKSLLVSYDGEEGAFLRANSFLLETLLHNLLSNAIRHTPSGGEIHISCTKQSLHFSNSGSSALQKEHLFERFSIHTTDKVNSGLGLAIIHEIANKYAWKLSYQFGEGFHHFTVTF